jgi:MerR family mercuric resistance operon transcriptional regulator
VHKIASAHLSDVRNKFSDLIKLESVLAETVAQCSDALPTSQCPVLDILDAGRQSDLNHISDV